jgi:hypothetical protein
MTLVACRVEEGKEHAEGEPWVPIEHARGHRATATIDTSAKTWTSVATMA